MQDIIEKIYRGELYPAEQIEPMLQNFHNKWKESEENTIAFLSKLTDEQKSLFEAVIQSKLEVATLEQTQAYVDGFKLGAKLLCEVFSDIPVSEKE